MAQWDVCLFRLLLILQKLVLFNMDHILSEALFFIGVPVGVVTDDLLNLADFALSGLFERGAVVHWH